MNKRNIIFGFGCYVLFGRRLVCVLVGVAVYQQYCERGFPGVPAMASIEKGTLSVTKGSFKGLADETEGMASIYQLADAGGDYV